MLRLKARSLRFFRVASDLWLGKRKSSRETRLGRSVESPSREVTLTVYFFCLKLNTPRQEGGAARAELSPSLWIKWQRSLISPPSSRLRLWLKDTDRPRNGIGDPGLVAGDGKVPRVPKLSFDDDQRRELSLQNQMSDKFLRNGVYTLCY